MKRVFRNAGIGSTDAIDDELNFDQFCGFITILGAALLGMFVRRWVPDEHLGTDTKDVIRLVTGITATMSGLVLGMLVSSAKAYYDARTSEVARSPPNVTVDRSLAQYGSETGEIRLQFHLLVTAGVNRLWQSQESMAVALRPKENGEALFDQMQLMTPKTEAQAAAKARAIPMIVGLQQTQWLMFL